ncbi:MAG: hypothetical protein ISR35_06375 [Planctomycetes bacterium]|nr:hypothetical protein [Planctomycetota bacterium]
MMSEHALSMRKLLINSLTKHWDGKDSILEMKRSGSRNWRQTEWPGWYFEFKALQCLHEKFGESVPFELDSRRNVDFSYGGKNWDLKHRTISNTIKTWIPSNDVEFIEHCIQKTGHWGLIVGVGKSVMGEKSRNCDFQVWHTNLSGGPSEYSKKKTKEGAKSRARKINSTLEDIYMIEFTSIDQLNFAVEEGWASPNFQKNMKNSNDVLRKPKYMFRLDKIADLMSRLP